MAISRTGAATPEVANTASAASGNASVLRCASARTGRDASLLIPASPLSNRNNVPYNMERCSDLTNSTLQRRWPHIDAKKEKPMQDTPVALVTGANKGIGLQIAKDL